MGVNLTLLHSSETLSVQNNTPELLSLEYSNEHLMDLRDQVTVNIRLAAQGISPEVHFFRYRLKAEDNFFSVMARTMMDHDTLSSINRLASLWDLKTGDLWLIPNARGIAVYGKPEEIAKQYKTTLQSLIPVPGSDRLYFIPGGSFSSSERNYLSLKIFIKPVEAPVSSNYGSRNDPFTQKNRFHHGIDLACPSGSTVKAAADGKVVFSGEYGGYGNLVIIEHTNGYQTYYGHLQKSLVKKGDQVTQGQKIALSGSTGRSTGPHLHFEVRRKGKPVSPSHHIGKR